jgi:phosphoglycolate phosphatase-like HAD superfamily hydrolase
MKNILTCWDIDGTLVNVYRYHTPSYQQAIKKVWGVEPSFAEIEANYGLPASEVIAVPLRGYQVSEPDIQAGMEQAFALYATSLEQKIRAASANPEEQKIILPGVIALLDMLKALDIPRAIVSGNIRRSGEAVIKGAGLDSYFDPRISSYADNITERSKIVQNAIRLATENRQINSRARVFVFGDTPADIKAARECGCTSLIAIKNSNDSDSSPGGKSYLQRKELLRDAHPDFLFDDWTDMLRILPILRR